MPLQRTHASLAQAPLPGVARHRMKTAGVLGAAAPLYAHPEPPCFANVLIGNAYHTVLYERESNFRRLSPNQSIRFHLAHLLEKERPAAVASFATREEAEAWFRAQRRPVRRLWLNIAGSLFFAAYQPNIHHYALFPVSMAEGDE